MNIGTHMADEYVGIAGFPSEARTVEVDAAAVERLADLSRRELEVLQQLLDGKSQARMAEDLYVSHHTVHSHVKSILAKTNVQSSLEAVSLAVRAGMRPSGCEPLDGTPTAVLFESSP